jgi:hypothetical protein
MTAETETPQIWKSFFAAVGAEYRPSKEITGLSGLTHEVQAIGVDDKTKRVIVVSAEHNPRIAALMRIDIQATMQDARVLVARPVAIDLAHAARTLFHTPEGNLDLPKVMEFGALLTSGDKSGVQLTKKISPALTPLMDTIGRSGLPIRSHILNTFEQIAALDWRQIAGGDGESIPQQAFNLLDLLRNVDNLAGDRAQGICPVPTYELTESDWELFERGRNIDDVRERLKALGVFQYFFPSPDALVLGIVDSGLGTKESIGRGLSIAEQDGHQFSQNELVDRLARLPDLLEALRDKGYIAEGEASLELTDTGNTFRESVRYRPREGLVSKIAQRITVKVSASLDDLFKMGSGL